MPDDLNDSTPNKKRKRCSLDNYSSSTPNFTTKNSRDFIFDNPGLDLCSDPTKNKNKVGKNGCNAAYAVDSCMEVKSISDLVVKDPFEVVRKPPKKKKRIHNIEENCFVNEGLNLNLAEKNPVNPFEVKRPNENNESNESTHCFINSGLNIRGPESNINPFEVARGKPIETANIKNTGIENLGLEVQPPLSLALPFTPTINRRINFRNISPSTLQSPSAMLAKTLVFSPEENKSISIKRVTELSVISEESLDIDKELDYYQLELENSINEAKTRKDKTSRSLMDNKHISNLALKLKNLKEDHEIDEIDDKSATFIIEIKTQETLVQTAEVVIEHKPQQENNNVSEVEEVEGVQYEEVHEDDDSRIDDDFDFKDPVPFKRAYRPSSRIKEQGEEKPQKENISNSHNFIKDIRKSIRKFINHSNGDDIKKTAQPSKESHHGLLSTIRQSFRRKPKIAEDNQKLEHEVSIVDETEKRQIFRQPEADCEGNTRKSRRHKKIYF